MVRNGYWTGLLVGCIVMAVANVFLPLLTATTVATYAGYRTAKHDGVRGQSFNILLGLCLAVSFYTLFRQIPSPAIEMVASLGLLLVIAKIVVSIPGRGVMSSIASPDTQLAIAAVKGKSLVTLLGALVNGPVLAGVTIIALAIIPLVVLDLLINLLIDGGEDLLLLVGIPSLALGTMIWDSVDRAIGAVIGFGDSNLGETHDQITSNSDEGSKRTTFPSEAFEMAQRVYAEVDAELPPAADSEWSSQDIARLTESELAELTRASFEREAQDGDTTEILDIERSTGTREMTLLFERETSLELAVLSIRFDGTENVDENELVELVRTKTQAAGVEPDMVILSVSTDIPLETKARWLAEYGIMVYDNQLLRRQFLVHDPGRSPDRSGSNLSV